MGLSMPLSICQCFPSQPAFQLGVRGPCCVGTGASAYHGAGVAGMCGACIETKATKGAASVATPASHRRVSLPTTAVS